MSGTIIGHRQIVEQLQRTVASDRIAGAYLFAGPAGVGKETVASYFARLIFCHEKTEPGTVCEPSGSNLHPSQYCLPCRKIASGNHPDFRFIRPIGRQLKIAQIRELQKQIIYEPFEASRKVYILTDAERMNTAAENCLLKTLEEPPGSSVLILLTANLEALLPTTRSRCQILQFHPMQIRELTEVLTKKCAISPKQATAIAIASEGAIGKALTQLEKGTALTQEIPEIIKETELLAAFRFAEQFKNEPERLTELVTWYRDILFLQQGAPNELITHTDSIEQLKLLLPRYSRLRIQQAIRAIFHTKALIENTNTNAILALEVMCLKLLKPYR